MNTDTWVKDTWVERHRGTIRTWVKDTWVERHNKDTGPHGYKDTGTELGHKIQSQGRMGTNVRGRKDTWAQGHNKDTTRTRDIRTQGHMGQRTQGHNTIRSEGCKDN